MRGPPIAYGLVGLAVAGVAVLAVVELARGQRRDPARCVPPLVAYESRCCAPGQTSKDGACHGKPSHCPPGMDFASGPVEGCIANFRRVRIHGGMLRIGASDWETTGPKQAHVAQIAPFDIDNVEVSEQRWLHCTATRTCRPRPLREPGLPVTNVTPEEAEQFCMLGGGRLPTADEWMFASSGGEGRRFPWGPTGLVCRRASFGLVGGPCAEGAAGPDLAGARPDGATPERVLDLAGNVAEWTREPDGSYSARGGSYRSREAAQLKSWASVPMPSDKSAPYIGFRCAYDAR